MGNSPEASKKADTTSPVQRNATPPEPTESVVVTKPEESKTETAEPLAPPPRPGAGQPGANGDYFSGDHHLKFETNPFESSFAGGGSTNGGGAHTPGGTKLPSVAALTSPAGLLGGTTPGFWSLRSGPLSPAMLSGPQKDDYFSDGHHLRGGFPTPNESSLRSGLTPGGGGSMFPEPSPNSQSFMFPSGGATPTTIDFHRTALNAASLNKREAAHPQPSITSQPQESANGLEVKPLMPGQFEHDANDAANGLYLLAQSRNGPTPQTNHYTPVTQMPVHAHPQQNLSMGGSAEASPTMAHRNGGSLSTASGRAVSEMSNASEEDEQQNRPNTRGKGKKGGQANGRRKAEDTLTKGSASKKAKANNGAAMEPEPQSEEELDLNKDEYNANGKKMTDDEKRKNFLERNRVAALKCRQRKKQWLANLQSKVELFSSENDSLSAQITQLRDEVVNLKTLLLAHKDCPITQQQGLQGLGMQHIMESGSGYGPPGQMGQMGQMNPYGMGLPTQQQVMANAPMQDSRRFS